MEYSIELKGVREFMADLETAPAVLDAADFMAMSKSVLLVEAEAKALVPRRTGRLFSSIGSSISDGGGHGGMEGRVGTSVDYARFIEFGTADHEIAPFNPQAGDIRRGRQALFWAGAAHPVARVHHPGTRAYEFMGGALERSKDSIVDFFKDAAGKLVEHLAGK